MKAINPGLIEYLRSNSRVRILSNKHSLPRRLLFLMDGAAIFTAFLFAYFLRYNFDYSPILFGFALKQSLLSLIVYLAFEVIFRSFAGLENRTTIQDIFKVFISITCSIAVLVLITSLNSQLAWQFDFINIPRSILLIHYISVLILLSIFRMVFKAKA